MLEYLRKNTKSWAVRVLLGLICLAFVLFFGTAGGLGARQTMVTVGDTPITLTDFQRARERNQNFYQQQYADRLTPELLRALDIPGLTLNELIESAIVKNEATALGLSVPDEAVRLEIREIEAFHNGGQFSPTAYRTYLQRQGLSPANFENAFRDELLREQLVDLIRRGVHVTEDEAFEQFRKNGTKVAVSYIKVAGSAFADEVEVDDAALSAFLAENGEDYREPDSVRVDYIAYETSTFADPSAVDAEDIEEYYHLNVDDEFTEQESVSARHILKKFDGDDDASKAKAREAIDAVVERLRAGEDFAAVAREESEDGSAEDGGDLGKFTRGRMVKPFEEAAFAMKPGETSDVVESQFGYHVIHVYARSEGGQKTLEEVRDEIARKLADEAAADLAFDAAATDALDIFEGASMETIASERDLEIKTSSALRPGKLVPAIGSAPKFVAAAMALGEVGNTSEAVREGDTYYILRLAEKIPSFIPPLADIRERVEADLRAQRAGDLARAAAAALLEQARAGKSLDELAEEGGYEVEVTDTFVRRGEFVPGIGSIAGVKEAAFAASEDGDVLPRVFLNRSDAYVFARSAREEVDREQFEEAKDDLLAAVRRRKEQAVIDEYVRRLKTTLDISYNQPLIEQFLR